MNRWFVIYRIFSINVLLFSINVVYSLQTHLQSALASSDTSNSSSPASRPYSCSDSSFLETQNDVSDTFSSDKFKFLGTSGTDNSTVEFDSNKYDLNQEKSGDKETLVYTFKEGAKCTELKYDGKTVWRYLPLGDNERYPTQVTVKRYKTSVDVYVESGYECVYTRDNNDWRLLRDRDRCYDPKNPPKGSQVSGVTVNFTKTSGNSDYDYNAEGNTRRFTAKDGKAFNTVKDGFLTKVWDTKDPNLYAKSVVYDGVGTQNLTLTLNHLNNTSTKFTKENNKWKQQTTKPESEESTKSESDESKNSENSQRTVQTPQSYQATKSQPELTKSEHEESTFETSQSDDMTEE